MIKAGKKLLLMAVSGIVMFTMLSNDTAVAATDEIEFQTTSGTFTYEEVGGSITITGYEGSTTILDIPELFEDITSDGMDITSIGKSAFRNIDTISQVILPSTVTSIGEYAFDGCGGLSTITFDSTAPVLASINNQAFSGCSGLANFTIPDTVTMIGVWAFSGTAVKNVIIPADCVSIGDGAFRYTEQLTNIEFAESDKLLSMGIGVFDHSGISSIVIPERMAGTDGTVVIPEEMFWSCANLRTVVLPDNCSMLGDSAFYHCNALNSINLPEGLITISDSALRDTALNDITIPSTVTYIGANAFDSCYDIGIVDFIGNPSTISSNAFVKYDYAENAVFYCDQGAENVIAQANDKEIPYQYHTDELSFVTLPTKKNYYYGEMLDYTTGISLKAVLSAAPDSEWVLDDTAIANCTVSGFNPKQVGKQMITIAYGGQKVTYDVNVYYNMENSSHISVEGIVANTYNPNEPYEPEVTVTNKVTKITLTEGTHYNVTYENNDAAGTAMATITGLESANYSGSISINYTVNKRNISDEAIVATVSDKTYTGSQIKPSLEDITLTYGDTVLQAGIDYQLRELSTYGENLNVGTGYVMIEGLTNYTGTRMLEFKINRKNLASEDIVVEYNDKATYSGSAITPSVAVTYGNMVLNSDYTNDYTVSYKNNIDAGTGTIVITAAEDTSYSACNYSGTIEKEFTIAPCDLTTDMITVSEEIEYTGKAATPEVVVMNNAMTLTENKDYTVTCESVNVGEATVTIEGIGNYKGVIEKGFTITTCSIESAEIEEIADVDYTGEAVEPSDIEVTMGDSVLEKGIDYTVAYENNVNAGMATVVVTGTGNYHGSLTTTFRIVGIDISADEEGEDAPIEISLSKDTFAYTGSEICPEPTVTFLAGETTVELVKDTDYTLEYENNVNAGTAKVIIAGIGKYEGTLTATYTIAPIDLEEMAIVTVGQTNTTYTGKAITPDVTVAFKSDTSIVLEEGVDYAVTYEDNMNAGTAKIIIDGLNNCSGTITKEFVIGQRDITLEATVSGVPVSVFYENKAVELDLSVGLGTKMLTEGSDYEVSYVDNNKMGTATVTVSFKGNYTGRITKSFNIIARDISTAVVSGITDVDFSGEAITHNIIVIYEGATLIENQDYTVAYRNNTSTGTAVVTITGMNGYTGVITKTFNISAIDISNAVVSGIVDAVYTGSAITYNPVVTYNNSALIAGTDYTVSYTNNENTGVATVTITGIGKYCGTIQKTFTISAFAITENNVTLNTTEKVYAATNPELDLDVVVGNDVLTENVDYRLSYANQDKPGIATVTVTGIGNYSGSVSRSYTVTPNKVTIKSVQNKKGKKLVTNWKKEKGVSGYEITIATNKKFKAGKKVKNTKSGSYTFKNLKKKKYYVRVRAYVKVNGKNVYGEYSKVKTIRIKK